MRPAGTGEGDAGPLEHLHAGRLEQDAGTHGTGLGRLLEQRHPVAVPREQQCRRATGGAGADDRDASTGVRNYARFRRPPITA
jgi:hypothetical protein